MLGAQRKKPGCPRLFVTFSLGRNRPSCRSSPIRGGWAFGELGPDPNISSHSQMLAIVEQSIVVKIHDRKAQIKVTPNQFAMPQVKLRKQ